jgi:hypothetical protein
MISRIAAAQPTTYVVLASQVMTESEMSVSTGGSVSTTFTVRVAEPVLPAKSVAE